MVRPSSRWSLRRGGGCRRTSDRPRRGWSAIWSSVRSSIERRSISASPSVDAGRLASASIAPCRIWAAASLSTFSARLARLTSASIIARSTACVDQRSSHSSTGRPSGAEVAGESADRLGARAIAAVQVERQADDQPRRCSCAVMNALSASRSCVNLVRRIVSAGPAKCQPASQIARPIVFVPTSRPASSPAIRQALQRTPPRCAVISAAKPPASVRHRGGPRPRTGRNRRRDNCCRAARRDRAAEWRRRSSGDPRRNGRRPRLRSRSRGVRSAVGTRCRD